MKNLIYVLTIIGLLLFSTSAMAAPFLVCDPQVEATHYTVIQDGVEIATDVVAQPDGSLRYDLAGVDPGAYEFNAQACNVWGCSGVSVDPTQSPEPTVPSTGLEMVR